MAVARASSASGVSTERRKASICFERAIRRASRESFGISVGFAMDSCKRVSELCDLRLGLADAAAFFADQADGLVDHVRRYIQCRTQADRALAAAHGQQSD